MKNKKKLTIEKLRTFSGHEYYTDQEAIKLVSSINTLSRILFEICKNEELKGKVITNEEPSSTIFNDCIITSQEMLR